MHVDVREVGEVRDNCGFAHTGQGQIMNLSQISGHDVEERNSEWNDGRNGNKNGGENDQSC